MELAAPTAGCASSARWEHTSLVTALERFEEENAINRRARERVSRELAA